MTASNVTESLLRQLVRSILCERDLAATRNMVKHDVLAVAGAVLRAGTGDKGEVRLQPVDPDRKPTPEQIRRILDKAGHPVEREIAVGDPGSRSGKFITYRTESGVDVVVASGANKGQKFERGIVADVDSEDTESLRKALGLSKRDVISVEKGASNARRPISSEPTDVGDVIADVIFRLRDGDAVRVSLKDPSGSTFGNFGYKGSFRESSRGITPVPNPRDPIVEALGIDKDELARGLTAFAQGSGALSPSVDHPPCDPDLVRGILASAYGYGYWYARKTSDGWNVVDLTTEDALMHHVGDVIVDRVVYPGANKQCSAYVSTSTGGRYKFEVRNTKGGILPNQINVKALGKAKGDRS